MEIKVYLYPYSAEEARQRNELSLWRASHQANIACKQAIEESIRQNFDGMHLDDDCLRPILEAFGYKRTAWVLSNTLREKNWDGRFSPVNKAWSKRISVPHDPHHNSDFAVDSHPAILDGFVDLFRRAYQELNLFGPEHCHPDSFSSLDSGEPALVRPRRLWMSSSCHRALHPLYLPGRWRDDPVEPDGFHRRVGRAIPARLGGRKAGPADKPGADRPHYGRHNDVRRKAI